jgi:nucleoside-diphosphate-sugar epimerase
MFDLKDQAALVTGGAGFIGSFLTEGLLDRGADVVVADNFSRGNYEKIYQSVTDEYRLTEYGTRMVAMFSQIVEC